MADRAAISVAVTGTWLSTAGVFVFARPAPAPPPTWPVPASALLVVTSTAAFPAKAAVEGLCSVRPCRFASREASGSERLRLPPQVDPQPTHPVHQNAAGHREVCSDVDVTPAVYKSAVYKSAVQQRAVICRQILEEGAKSVSSHNVHWGDLSTT